MKTEETNGNVNASYPPEVAELLLKFIKKTSDMKGFGAYFRTGKIYNGKTKV